VEVNQLDPARMILDAKRRRRMEEIVKLGIGTRTFTPF
jgi:hypothetical protein